MMQPPNRTSFIASANQTTVRPLTSQDWPAIIELRRRAPFRLLTPIMHLEGYGFASPIQWAWGAFSLEHSDRLEGILLRFHNSIIAADLNGCCGATFARIIDDEKGVAGIRASHELIQTLRENLHRYHTTDGEESVFQRLSVPPQIAPDQQVSVRRACPNDLGRLAALYAGAGMMYRSHNNVADKLAQVRVFVVDEVLKDESQGRILSSALLNVETHEAGLIGGVFTHATARGQGYAAACVGALAADLQRDGKLPCLFYENPVAGRVYARLGFETVDRWAVLFLSPNRK